VQSVVNDPSSVQHPQLAACRRHLVDVSDSEQSNLLSLLPAAVAFISAALQPSGSSTGGSSGGGSSGGGSKMLVHCAQGVSRSAAVAAAYLMAASAAPAAPAAATPPQQPQRRAGASSSEPLSPDAALAVLRRACPAAAPNTGFMEQLELFYAMGCRLEDSYVPYKRFLLQQVWRPCVENAGRSGRAAAVAHACAALLVCWCPLARPALFCTTRHQVIPSTCPPIHPPLTATGCTALPGDRDPPRGSGAAAASRGARRRCRHVPLPQVPLPGGHLSQRCGHRAGGQ